MRRGRSRAYTAVIVRVFAARLRKTGRRFSDRGKNDGARGERFFFGEMRASHSFLINLQFIPMGDMICTLASALLRVHMRTVLQRTKRTEIGAPHIGPVKKHFQSGGR